MEAQATNTSQQVPELSGDASGSNDTRTTGPTSDRVGDSNNNRVGDKKGNEEYKKTKRREREREKRDREIEREGIGDHNPNCKLR